VRFSSVQFHGECGDLISSWKRSVPATPGKMVALESGERNPRLFLKSYFVYNCIPPSILKVLCQEFRFTQVLIVGC